MAYLISPFDIVVSPPVVCQPQLPSWPWSAWNRSPLFSPRRYHCYPLPSTPFTPATILSTPLTPLPNPLPAIEDQRPIITPGFLSCPTPAPHHCCHCHSHTPCHGCHCHCQCHCSPQISPREPLPAWPPAVHVSPAEPRVTLPWQPIVLPPPPPLQVTPMIKFNELAPHTPSIYWDVSRNPRISAILLGNPSSPIDFTRPAFNLPSGTIRELTITFRGWMARHPIRIRDRSNFTIGFLLDKIYRHLRRPLGEAGLREFERNATSMEMLANALQARQQSETGDGVNQFRRVDTLGPDVYFQGISVAATTGRGTYTVEVITTRRNG